MVRTCPRTPSTTVFLQSSSKPEEFAHRTSHEQVRLESAQALQPAEDLVRPCMASSAVARPKAAWKFAQLAGWARSAGCRQRPGRSAAGGGAARGHPRSWSPRACSTTNPASRSKVRTLPVPFTSTKCEKPRTATIDSPGRPSRARSMPLARPGLRLKRRRSPSHGSSVRAPPLSASCCKLPQRMASAKVLWRSILLWSQSLSENSSTMKRASSLSCSTVLSP
mmetsp:Transcript_8908/g.27024  ORF Transcript_8908/g.27024 Transcript_8908/m.27024 type:complete len:223 (+) Transcript_8908:874-1542(+)